MSTFERLPTISHAVFLPIHYILFRVEVFRLGNWLRYYRTKKSERERDTDKDREICKDRYKDKDTDR